MRKYYTDMCCNTFNDITNFETEFELTKEQAILFNILLELKEFRDEFEKVNKKQTKIKNKICNNK